MDYLYTYGSEFVDEAGYGYAGHYNVVDGVAYTGMYLNEYSKILLNKAEINVYKTISIEDGIQTPANEFERFKSIKIKSHYPTVSEDDYTRGYIVRYFCKHKLHYPYNIFEIDQSEYVNVKSAQDIPYILYEALELNWMVSTIGGNVDIVSTNFKTLTSLEQQFRGISKYFTNLKEFSVL